MNDIVKLPSALSAWKTASFAAVLKHEIEALGVAHIPLERWDGTVDDDIVVMVLGAKDSGIHIEVRITILYTVTETAYCCPIGPIEQSSHCHDEMTVQIDKKTAKAVFLAISPD